MFGVVFLTLCLTNAVVFAEELADNGDDSSLRPVVVTGINKLDKSFNLMNARQLEDAKKKQQLETLCQGEIAGEIAKQTASTGRIKENLQNIELLEGNIKGYDAQLRNWTAELEIGEARVQSWKRIQGRTAQMKVLAADQLENFHVELQNASDTVTNFLGMIKEMHEQKAVENENAAKAVVADTETGAHVELVGKETKEEADESHSKLQSPLTSILNAISLARNQSITHQTRNSEKSEQFRKMVESNVNQQSQLLDALRKRVRALGDANAQARTQLQNRRTAVEIDKQHLEESHQVKAYFTDICQSYVTGITGRMQQRESVQKETQSAINWFRGQIQEIALVMQNLEQAKHVVLSKTPVEPPKPKVFAPPEPIVLPCTGGLCNHALIRRKNTGNQQTLDVDSKPAPQNPPQNPPPRFRQNPQHPQQFQDIPHPEAPRFRHYFLPAYTGQQIINADDDKMKDQAKDQLAKELSNEFDNQLQSERDRLSNSKKSASAMRVGYKM